MLCYRATKESIVASTAGHRKGHVDLMIGRRVDFWPHGHVMFFPLWLLILAALFNQWICLRIGSQAPETLIDSLHDLK